MPISKTILIAVIGIIGLIIVLIIAWKVWGFINPLKLFDEWGAKLLDAVDKIFNVTALLEWQ